MLFAFLSLLSLTESNQDFCEDTRNNAVFVGTDLCLEIRKVHRDGHIICHSTLLGHPPYQDCVDARNKEQCDSDDVSCIEYALALEGVPYMPFEVSSQIKPT